MKTFHEGSYPSLTLPILVAVKFSSKAWSEQRRCEHKSQLQPPENSHSATGNAQWVTPISTIRAKVASLKRSPHLC